MAWTGNYICTSFKKDILRARHNFDNPGGHSFKVALYDSNASLNAATTDYSTTDEITGTGYTAGGMALTAISPVSSGTSGLADFVDLSILAATLTARGALIYNTTTAGGSGTTDAVCVLDFASNRSAIAQEFKIIFPTADSINAIILNK